MKNITQFRRDTALITIVVTICCSMRTHSNYVFRWYSLYTLKMDSQVSCHDMKSFCQTLWATRSASRRYSISLQFYELKLFKRICIDMANITFTRHACTRYVCCHSSANLMTFAIMFLCLHYVLDVFIRCRQTQFPSSLLAHSWQRMMMDRLDFIKCILKVQLCVSEGTQHSATTDIQTCLANTLSFKAPLCSHKY